MKRLLAVAVLVAALSGAGCSGNGLGEACLTNGFGAELCGQDAVDYCHNLEDTGYYKQFGGNGFADKSRDVCDEIYASEGE